MNNYEYTWYKTRNAVASGEARSDCLPDIFPKHFIAPRKHDVPCIVPALINGRRSNDNVTASTMLILDVDHEPKSRVDYENQFESLYAASAKLETDGIEHLVYSSYNHGRPKDNPDHPYFGFRAVIPYTTPLDATNSKHVGSDFKRLARAVIERYSLPGNLLALSQPWYVASVPDAEALARATWEYFPGVGLDPANFKYTKASRGPNQVTAEDRVADISADHAAAEITTRVVMMQFRFGSKAGAALQYVLEGKVPAAGEVKSRHDEIILPATRAVAKMLTEDEDVDDAMKFFSGWVEKLDEVYPRSGGTWAGEVRRALSGAIAKVPQWRAEARAYTAELEAEADAYTESLRRKRENP
jgi:hypothetical protein